MKSQKKMRAELAKMKRNLDIVEKEYKRQEKILKQTQTQEERELNINSTVQVIDKDSEFYGWVAQVRGFSDFREDEDMSIAPVKLKIYAKLKGKKLLAPPEEHVWIRRDRVVSLEGPSDLCW